MMKILRWITSLLKRRSIEPALSHCSKKPERGLDRSIVLDPLADPRDPRHRHEACPAAHLARPHPRMVILAQGSSGQRAQAPSQTKIAPVMLA
ncbi:hypothetical protein [Bradyrhizobium sp. CB3481]|uniref:hypothetical protein n=1 Tax=Bradyrhizobium sp. CB3481 TaxID=3039158 RepID=UPI0024B23510|nr:hypothetical protein [Bradyrhizobium sp. CB3481]WFU14902.1 hypothetical protein QA643_28355 [Bradyrhizobium sp. CB3481]